MAGINTISDAVNQTAVPLPNSPILEIPGSELEEGEDVDLAAAVHMSLVTYYMENHVRKSSSITARNPSKQPKVRRIQEDVSSDIRQPAFAIAGKTQPEQNPHTEPKNLRTAANTYAEAKADKQDQTPRISPPLSKYPSWRSGAPLKVDSEDKTPVLSMATLSTSSLLLGAWSERPKRLVELENDENPAQVHEKKVRSH